MAPKRTWIYKLLKLLFEFFVMLATAYDVRVIAFRSY